MAQDKWLVIYNPETEGPGQQVPFSQTSTAGHAVKGGFEPTVQASCVLVEAESSQEAATGIRRAYGDGVVNGSMKVIKNSNVEEKTA